MKDSASKAYVLKGAQVTLNNIDTDTVSESGKISIVGATQALPNPDTSILPGAAVKLAYAEQGKGDGTHVITFGSQDTKDKSVQLDVPGASRKMKDKYKTTFTYSLVDVPDAVNPGGSLSPNA
jgi:hypothetical protein